MPTTPEYSVWIMPLHTGKAYRALVRCNRFISEAWGSPEFIPHTTLVTGLAGDERELGVKTARLAASLMKFEVLLGKPNTRGTYHEILFVHVAPSVALKKACDKAEEIFGLPCPPEPRISLAYAKRTEEEAREMIEKIAAEGIVLTGRGFKGSALELWRTDGTVADWKRIGVFKFKNA